MFRNYKYKIEKGLGYPSTDYVTLVYDEVVAAKEKIQSWVETIPADYEIKDLVEAIQKLPVPQRAVIACGEIIYTNGYQFQMPSTKEVMEYDVSEIDSSDRSGVEFTVIRELSSATDNGYYQESAITKINTGRFRR